MFVGVAAGGGGCTCTGGVGDRLGPVSVVEYRDGGVEADSVLEVYLALGTVPEVDGLGCRARPGRSVRRGRRGRKSGSGGSACFSWFDFYSRRLNGG